MKKQTLTDIFRLQKKLNDNTNSPSWVFGISKYGNDINWLRCIHMEVAELIESRPWKHWKNLNAAADEENEKVELTDILHFLVSYGIHSFFMKKLYLLEAELIERATRKELIKDPDINMKEFDTYRKIIDASIFEEELLNHKYSNLLLRLNNPNIVIDETIYNEFYNEIEEELIEFTIKEMNKKYLFKEGISLVSKYEHLSLFALPGSILENNDEKTLEYFITKEMYYSKIVNIFFSIVGYDIKFNLPGFYFGKNCLNQFRQDNGYKEGTYKKIWFGEEDNIHMLKIVTILGLEAEFDNIYTELDSLYKTL